METKKKILEIHHELPTNLQEELFNYAKYLAIKNNPSLDDLAEGEIEQSEEVN
jgi:hypothetical protein